VPIHVEPLGSVLYYSFTGHLTLHDIEALNVDEAPFFTALPEGDYLGVIIDLSNLDTIAAELFPWLPRLRFVSDGRVQVALIVGANPYLRALVISLGALTGRQKFVFCHTVQDALDVIAAHPEVNVLSHG
jgi:hypothetical protein